MALSPAHRWGQIVGEVLESAVLPVLRTFASEHGLYLDRKETRACRKGLKCTWIDGHGNAHDLDFVLERGGTPQSVGTPVAFIEVAWRRYTKHSRNKAQEIQGAIIPLAEKYRNSAPFKGAVLAGVFTEGALTQMRSLGFTILYFPYEMVVRAFKSYGIDASSEENTDDAIFQRRVDRYERLSPGKRAKLAAGLINLNAGQVGEFVASLAAAVFRRIERIIVLPLHGSPEELASLDDAIAFIANYASENGNRPVRRYEIQIRYGSGDAIEGRFADKEGAVAFLKGYK